MKAAHARVYTKSSEHVWPPNICARIILAALLVKAKAGGYSNVNNNNNKTKNR